MLMWVMSDRAIPRSYRMMQGFGVHTFRLVNAEGESHFVKFHWKPTAGHAFAGLGRGGQDLRRRPRLPPARSVGGDRGGRLSRVGAGPADLHRGAGRGLQLRRARRRPRSSPRSWCRCVPVGRMVLNRNPDNFFAETEQVAFCTAHIVPGIDFTQRSAARRAASIRTSTRRSRGWAARTSTRSRSTRRSRRCTTTSATACIGRRSTAAASPTSRTRSAAAVRSRPAPAGFVSFAEPRWSRATTRCAASPSGSPITTRRRRCSGTARPTSRSTHIINAFRFELSRVQTPAVRERMVSGLMNVAPELAEAVADRARHPRDAGADAEGARRRT